MHNQIEVPASLQARLTAEQLDKLQEHARTHHDSRKHIVAMEKLMSGGMSFDDAHKKALEQVGK